MWATEGFHYWWLIPLILIALCFFWGKGCCFRRRDRFTDDPSKTDETALEILDKRYARGEIDEQEYERKKERITQKTKGAQHE